MRHLAGREHLLLVIQVTVPIHLFDRHESESKLSGIPLGIIHIAGFVPYFGQCFHICSWQESEEVSSHTLPSGRKVIRKHHVELYACLASGTIQNPLYDKFFPVRMQDGLPNRVRLSEKFMGKILHE